MNLTLEIPGDPVTWQRPRVGRSPSGKPYFFEAPRVKNWKNYIRDIASAKMQGLPLLGGDPKNPVPLSVELNFYLRRPGRLFRKKDPEVAVPCLSRPDIDNLYKGVVDALQGVVFRNDSLIWCIVVTKMFHPKNGGPRTVIKIEEMSSP